MPCPPEFSQLYLAIDGVLSAVICISDPLREEARAVLSALRNLGVKNPGDADRGQPPYRRFHCGATGSR
mgnify:CR=1 FL=1